MAEKKKKKGGQHTYPIVKWVGNVPIRKNNLVSIYIPQHEMEKIAAVMDRTGLSCAKILSLSATPCGACKHQPMLFTIGSITFEIPRGLMTFRKTNSGRPMTKHKHRKS